MKKFSPKSVERIRVVVFEGDMVELFTEALKSINGGFLSKGKNIPNSLKKFVKMITVNEF